LTNRASKPIMASMIRCLLVNQVIKRGLLDPRTTRYVLERHRHLNIPASTGRGQHRKFNVDEAIRLAVCTQLVMLGFPLEKAETMTMWCQDYWRAIAHDSKGQRLFQSFKGGPWTLTIMNGTHVRLRRQHPQENEINFNDDEFIRIADNKKEHYYDLEDHLPFITWNLTGLSNLVAREARDSGDNSV
jgi:hypothetical protein